MKLFEYDDLFIYAPSFLAWEKGALTEGKSIGTAKEKDLVLLDRDKTMQALVNPEQHARERKAGSVVGRRVLKRVQAETRAKLLEMIQIHVDKETDPEDLREGVTDVMKEAWRKVFEAGIRAAGIQGRGRGKRGMHLEEEETAWLRDAIRHEMRFLNKFLDTIVEGGGVMPYPKRADMYVRALESFYDSARVIGMPATSVIRWVGVPDKRRCKGCEYLHEHNPYTKLTLPTTPRSGATPCLTNCRDRLLLRIVEGEEVLRITRDGRTREQHIRALRRIKAESRRRKAG